MQLISILLGITLFALWVFCHSSQAQTNVCSYSFIEGYKTWCWILTKFYRCTKYKTAVRTSCCDNWRSVTSNPHECTQPRCEAGWGLCYNGGTCVSPMQCACAQGFYPPDCKPCSDIVDNCNQCSNDGNFVCTFCGNGKELNAEGHCVDPVVTTEITTLETAQSTRVASTAEVIETTSGQTPDRNTKSPTEGVTSDGDTGEYTAGVTTDRGTGEYTTGVTNGSHVHCSDGESNVTGCPESTTGKQGEKVAVSASNRKRPYWSLIVLFAILK